MSHRDDVLTALATLFEEAGNAHQQAFLASGGRDEAWAQWYAHYTHDRLEALFDVEVSETDLAALFEEVEAGREADPGGRPWPEHYADAFAARFFES